MGHEQAPPGDGLLLPALAYASDEDCMVAGAKPAVAVADNPENIQDEDHHGQVFEFLGHHACANSPEAIIMSHVMSALTSWHAK